jgi:hypothetical protein
MEFLFQHWGKRILIIAFAVSLGVNGLFILANWYAVSAFGAEAALWFVGLLVFPLSVSLLCVPIGAIGLIFKKTRKLAATFSLACLIYFAVGVMCIKIGGEVRMWAFHGLAKRSTALVNAIEQFQEKYRHPPESLLSLVPEFLPSVPDTGMAAYPDYEYKVGEDAKSYGDNPWVLLVFTPSGGINFDMFMYFPNQKYPKHGYGGWLEKIGAWAYVHE